MAQLENSMDKHLHVIHLNRTEAVQLIENLTRTLGLGYGPTADVSVMDKGNPLYRIVFTLDSPMISSQRETIPAPPQGPEIKLITEP